MYVRTYRGGSQNVSNVFKVYGTVGIQKCPLVELPMVFRASVQVEFMDQTCWAPDGGCQREDPIYLTSLDNHTVHRRARPH